MSYLLLLAALLVAGLGVGLKRRWPGLGTGLLGLGGLGLIGVIVLQVRQNVFPTDAKTPNRYEMAVSFCLANCLLEDAGVKGGSVVLLFPQRRVMDEDTEQSYEDGFAPPLRHGHGNLALRAVHLEGEAHDLSAFKQALAQDQDALAVISFAGAPAGIETLAGQPKGPLFYVFDADATTNWLSALKTGGIRAAVVPKPGVDALNREKMAGMPDAIFGRFYLLATPANADEVAASLKVKK
jgi:hypothetical protein